MVARAWTTRFAPSPTGELHLGHAFSALTAWDAAVAAGGRFLLRIEDIDATRARPAFEAGIFEAGFFEAGFLAAGGLTRACSAACSSSRASSDSCMKPTVAELPASECASATVESAKG